MLQAVHLIVNEAEHSSQKADSSELHLRSTTGTEGLAQQTQHLAGIHEDLA